MDDDKIRHFCLPSYIIYMFLVNSPSSTRVFVIPHFEMLPSSKGEKTPKNFPITKNDLTRLWSEKKAFPFHKQLCDKCHAIPGIAEWIKKESKGNLRGEILANISKGET